MKILITGAEIVPCGNEYQIVYKDQIVFSHKNKQLAIAIAMDRDQLNEMLMTSNLYKLRVG